ncbi:MAG: NVEALA domain-containing protein [Dysgonomonas sp.]
MKKKIFGGIAVLAIAAMAAFNVNLNISDVETSALSLANVEALASEVDLKGELDKLSFSDYCKSHPELGCKITVTYNGQSLSKTADKMCKK